MRKEYLSPYLLCIDDDTDDLDLIKETIHAVNPNLAVISVTGGQEGYEFLESLLPGERYPCAITLDLNMPGWDGLTTLASIKEKQEFLNIPIYIFTNSNHPRHKEETIQKGAKDFISKPYEYANFVTICSKFATHAFDVPNSKS